MYRNYTLSCFYCIKIKHCLFIIQFLLFLFKIYNDDFLQNSILF